LTLRFLTAGESHGPMLTTILDGFPAGVPLTSGMIDRDLARRQKGFGAGPRMKLENDTAQITGGVMEGLTTGGPISILIENSDHTRWQGKAIDAMTAPRPGHADLTGAVKYGYNDLRPALERASARETASRVAIGAICRQLLAQFKIQVGGYVAAIGEVEVALSDIPLPERISKALDSEVGCPDPLAAEKMQARIRQIMEQKDTLGGVIEVAVLGLPVGLGSYAQWDQRLEARLGAAILSIQAIKGVEIGPAFENTRHPGTQVHDAILLDGEDLIRPTNRSGGLEGGVTTGQPLLIRAAMKPIGTTLTPQQTVDLASGEPVPTRYERSDFCPVPRGVVVVEAMTAFVLAGALLEKLGGDSLTEMLPRFDSLRKASRDDIKLDPTPHTWWPE
jgi:chorismate synthase